MTAAPAASPSSPSVRLTPLVVAVTKNQIQSRNSPIGRTRLRVTHEGHGLRCRGQPALVGKLQRQHGEGEARRRPGPAVLFGLGCRSISA